jgi:hypothetical protein
MLIRADQTHADQRDQCRQRQGSCRVSTKAPAPRRSGLQGCTRGSVRSRRSNSPNEPGWSADLGSWHFFSLEARCWASINWLWPPQDLQRRFLVSGTRSPSSSSSHRQTPCRNPSRRCMCLFGDSRNAALPACRSGGRSCVCASIRTKRQKLSPFLLINMGSNGPDPNPGQKKPAQSFAYLSSAFEPEFVSLVFLPW